jgi:long-subunit acyl-CoA synthetase (AMP-forming)
MVTHGNIVHNLASIYIHLPQRPGVTMISWMPQYHGAVVPSMAACLLLLL